MPLSEDIKKKIKDNLSKKLQEMGRSLVCPTCGSGNFILADGFTNDLLQDSISENLVIGGSRIPEIVLVCNHCGHIMKYSAGILGLLSEKQDGGKKDATK